MKLTSKEEKLVRVTSDYVLGMLSGDFLIADKSKLKEAADNVVEMLESRPLETIRHHDLSEPTQTSDK